MITNEMIERFDRAARTWGWEEDQGTGLETSNVLREYRSAKADLIAAIAPHSAAVKADTHALAVEVVDAVLGYSVENFGDPERQRALYQIVGERIRSAFSTADDDVDKCPVCAEPFKPDDICASDIELGYCHAACLEGAPTVDLETGEIIDGPIPTYPYSEVNPAAAVVVDKLQPPHTFLSDLMEGGCLKGVRAMSASVDSKRVLQLHFDHDVTDSDRARLVALHNSAVNPPEDVDESEIVAALLANQPFVFDPATNFMHADDGGAPEGGIRYVPADPAPAPVVNASAPAGTDLLVIYWEWTDDTPHAGAKHWACHSIENDGRIRDWPKIGLRARAASKVTVVDGVGLELLPKEQL